MKYYRINNRIQSPEVRVIDENGKNLGIFKIEEALKLAQKRGLDLVEISPLEKPPVAKIVDFSKFLYEQKKKEKQKKGKKQEIKVVRLSLRVGKHDLEIKRNQILKFLEKKQKVKIEMILKGREKTHLDLASKIFDDFIKSLGEKIKIERTLLKEEGRLTILISS